MSDTYVTNSAGKPSIAKDMNATLDYTFDWSLWLGIDTITSEVSSVVGDDNALTIGSPADSHTTTAVTVWAKGGTNGQTYLVTCKITTTAGRVDERTIAINVKDR